MICSTRVFIWLVRTRVRLHLPSDIYIFLCTRWLGTLLWAAMAMFRTFGSASITFSLLLIFLLSLSRFVAALYGPSSDVVLLSASNFKSKVINEALYDHSPHSFLLFYGVCCLAVRMQMLFPWPESCNIPSGNRSVSSGRKWYSFYLRFSTRSSCCLSWMRVGVGGFFFLRIINHSCIAKCHGSFLIAPNVCFSSLFWVLYLVSHPGKIERKRDKFYK